MTFFKKNYGEHLISFFVSGSRQRDVPRTTTHIPKDSIFSFTIPKEYCKMKWDERQLWLRWVH
jgi:hypothetical protein